MKMDDELARRMRLEGGFALTGDFRAATLKANATIEIGGIMAIDGPPGIGKSTTARFLAATADRPSAMVTMPNKPAPLDILRHTATALDPDQRWDNPSRFQLQQHLTSRMSEWGGTLIVDELQRCTVDAMNELVYLYEETEGRFALIAVGTDSIATASKYALLESRLMATQMFERLTGDALVEAVRALDERFASLSARVIGLHDDAYAKGLLRNWIYTLRWARKLTTSNLTEGDLRQIRSLASRGGDNN